MYLYIYIYPAIFFGRDSGADLTVWAAWESAPTYKNKTRQALSGRILSCIYREGGGLTVWAAWESAPTYTKGRNETGIEWTNTVVFS